MGSNIETNSPAFLATAAIQAVNALDRGDLDAVREILVEMHKTSRETVEWLASLARRGWSVPDDLTWTKHIHRRDDDAKKPRFYSFLGGCVRGVNAAESQDAVEEIVEKVAATMDDDMAFPEETWAETADRVEACYPSVAVVLRIAQERHRLLDPALLAVEYTGMGER